MDKNEHQRPNLAGYLDYCNRLAGGDLGLEQDANKAWLDTLSSAKPALVHYRLAHIMEQALAGGVSR